MNDNHIIDTNGNQFYIENGNLHRTDGPAVIYAHGPNFWYVNGTRILTWSHYQKLTKLADEQLTFLMLKYGDIT